MSLIYPIAHGFLSSRSAYRMHTSRPCLYPARSRARLLPALRSLSSPRIGVRGDGWRRALRRHRGGCVNPVAPAPPARRRARALRPASPPVRGEGRLRSCVPPSRQSKGRDGVPVSRVIARAWVRGRGRAYRGGAARAPDCARETPDAPRPSVPAGVFFAAPAIAFCRKAERRPRKPPLSTFILHHTAKCQAHPGTGNENPGYFARNAGRNEAWIDALRPFPSPRTPIRGPASVPAAVSAVELVLRRLRQHRESGMDPGSGSGATVGGVRCKVTGPRCVHAVARRPGVTTGGVGGEERACPELVAGARRAGRSRNSGCAVSAVALLWPLPIPERDTCRSPRSTMR